MRPGGRTIRMAGRERGVVLFVALVAMVVLSLAGVALIRTLDTSTSVAGNLAFRQASIAPINNAVERSAEGRRRVVGGGLHRSQHGRTPGGEQVAHGGGALVDGAGRLIGITSATDPAARSSSSEIQVVLNWFEELKARVPPIR